MEWAQVRQLAAEGHSMRQIAPRLSMNRRTVARLAGAPEPPRCRRGDSPSSVPRGTAVARGPEAG
jgi:hypothetical protein